MVKEAQRRQRVQQRAMSTAEDSTARKVGEEDLQVMVRRRSSSTEG